MESKSISALEAERAAAFAAWQSAPEKGRGAKAEKARLEVALAAATRALVQARRAAASTPVAGVSAAIDSALAARAAREKAAAAEAALQRAEALWDAAQEWPRCGQQWPATPAEVRADALLRANPGLWERLGYQPE